MIRSIPPRTMRNVWDEKRRRDSRPVHYGTTMHDYNTKQKYSNQINSIKTCGTSGALYAEGKLKHQSIQEQPRNIYERAGQQGTVYPKKPKSSIQKMKNALDLPSLDETIKDTGLEIFETGKKISVIIEQYLENITDVFYDTTKKGIIVHADKDYNIPLKLEKANTKPLEWHYNNGVIEVIFRKK